MTKIIQITDCHLQKNPDDLFYGVYPDETLKQVIAAANLHNPDLVLLTGDLSQDGSSESYQRLQTHLQTFACPVYCIPGNHDDPAQVPHPDVVDFNNWRFIFLNSVIPGETSGLLADSELKKLEMHLSSDLPTVICLHHHPLPINHFMDKYILKNHETFTRRLESYPQIKLVLFGHIHSNYAEKKSHITYLGSPASSVNCQGETFGAASAGFTVIEIMSRGDFNYQVVTL